MATIKIHLDNRRTKKDGTYPLAENGLTETPKDSLIYWIYDNKKSVLIDKKGFVYHK